MKKSRNSNIELLRIISIIMIVISHYSIHNGILKYTMPVGFNRFFLEISTLGNIGTIIFILITGYYLSKNDNGLKLTKIFKLYLQILFYSVFIYIVLVIFKLEPFNIKVLIKVFLPISFEEYWFASVYILLYIFHPYINRLLNKLDRKEHFKLVLTGLIIFSFLSTITTKKYFANELIQFILFYSIGAYLSKYKNNIFNNQKLNKIILIISSLILISSVIFFDIVGTKVNLFNQNSVYLFSRTSIISIAFAVSLFNIFINKKEKNNTHINSISTCVFGVYLIFDNNYIRNILWSDILKNKNYINSIFLVPHMIISVAIVFIICIYIEYIRKFILDNIYEKHISNYIEKLQLKLENTFNKICNKFKIN